LHPPRCSVAWTSAYQPEYPNQSESFVGTVEAARAFAGGKIGYHLVAVTYSPLTDDERQDLFFFSGLASYAFSFVLVAVIAQHDKVSGVDCAYITICSWLSLLEPRVPPQRSRLG
jgi:hypothetical protein